MADPSLPASSDVTPPTDVGESSDPSNTGAPARSPDTVPMDSKPFVGQPPPVLPARDLPSKS